MELGGGAAKLSSQDPQKGLHLFVPIKRPLAGTPRRAPTPSTNSIPRPHSPSCLAVAQFVLFVPRCLLILFPREKYFQIKNIRHLEYFCGFGSDTCCGETPPQAPAGER